MRQMLLIGHNDVRQFLRNVASYVWLFVVPIGFMYITGASSGSGKPSNPRPSVLVENIDQGFLGNLFMAELGAQGLRLVESNQTEEAERTLRIPADFTQRIQQREQVKLEFVKMEGSHPESAIMIEMRMTKALIGLNAHLFEYAQMSKGTPATMLDEQQFRVLLEEENPVKLQASFAGRNPIPTGFNQSLPGYMVMFLMMNLLIFGAASISRERQTGVIKRLAVYPLSRTQLVIGKIYGRLLLGLVQAAVFILAGIFLFRVNMGNQLFAIAVTLGIYAWLAAALGVFIGAVTRNPDQTVGLCVLTSILMAALGGCWWPLDVVPETLQMVGHVFPTAWAMDALHSLISFGEGFSVIGVELLVLTAFASGATLAAGRFFRI